MVKFLSGLSLIHLSDLHDDNYFLEQLDRTMVLTYLYSPTNKFSSVFYSGHFVLRSVF